MAILLVGCWQKVKCEHIRHIVFWFLLTNGVIFWSELWFAHFLGLPPVLTFTFFFFLSVDGAPAFAF